MLFVARFSFISKVFTNKFVVKAVTPYVMNSPIISSLILRLDKAEKHLKKVLTEVTDIKLELSKAVKQTHIEPISKRKKFDTLQYRDKQPTGINSDDDDEIDLCLKKFKYDETDSSASFNGTGSNSFNKENEYVIVYTDGACENNGRANAKAGLGVWWGDNHPLNVSMPVKGRATNNVGEIQACVKAVEQAIENNITKLIIKTDSQFVINSMTKWINGWRKNNWKTANKEDVKNKEDFVKLDAVQKKLEEVKYEYVPGHKGVKGNEEADKLAVAGAKRYNAF